MEKEKIKFKTVKRKVSELVDCSYNPRTLSNKQYKDLKNSFEKFGYVEICAINTDNTILAGHQRVHVMKDLGWEDKEIEVRIPSRKLTKKEFDEYLIRSNQNGGSYDWDLLANDFDFDDLKNWGFSEEELLGNIEIEEQQNDDKDEDELPQQPNNPVTKKNDIWILGNHRVMCGDSTKIEDVRKLISKDKIDLLFTDPMYNDKAKGFIKTINLIGVENILLMTTFNQAIQVINETDWHFKFDCVLYFKTPSSMMNKKVPYYLHKNIFYLTKDEKTETIFSCDNAKGHFSESGYYPSVIEAKKNTQEEHGLTKPVDCIISILSGYKAKKVLDLFAGSGTTLIACEKTQRHSYLMEIDEKYCDVIIKRWQEFTGKEAKLERSNETFNQLLEECENG